MVSSGYGQWYLSIDMFRARGLSLCLLRLRSWWAGNYGVSDVVGGSSLSLLHWHLTWVQGKPCSEKLGFVLVLRGGKWTFCPLLLWSQLKTDSLSKTRDGKTWQTFLDKRRVYNYLKWLHSGSVSSLPPHIFSSRQKENWEVNVFCIIGLNCCCCPSEQGSQQPCLPVLCTPACTEHLSPFWVFIK